MAIYVDPTTGKIIASPPGYTGIATDVACCCAAGNPCDPDPEILLTVTGASGTINWGGQVWNLPGDSGSQKSVCPKYYRKGAGTGHFPPTVSTYSESWQAYGNSLTGLSIARFWKQQSASYLVYKRFHQRLFGATANQDGRSYVNFGTGTTTLTWCNLNVLCGPQGTSKSNYRILNGQFGSATIGGITYAWARGQGW